MLVGTNTLANFAGLLMTKKKCFMKFVTGIKIRLGCHDNQHNNTQHSQIQDNDSQLKVKYDIFYCYAEFIKLRVIV